MNQILYNNFLQQIMPVWSDFQVALMVKNLPANAGDTRDAGSMSGCGRPPEVGNIFLPGKSNGQKSLAGYHPWGCEELDMTEQLILMCQYVTKKYNEIVLYPKVMWITSQLVSLKELLIVRRREWNHNPVFLPTEFHRQRSSMGCSPWGHRESYMT